MILDTSSPITANYPSSASFKQALLSISQHRIDRGQAETWASHLRFLTPLTQDGNPGASHGMADRNRPERSDSLVSNALPAPGSEISDDCVCNNDAYVPFAEDTQQLRLTSSSKLPDCVHYVAVSYCWDSAPPVGNDGGDWNSKTYTVHTDTGTRPARANKDVLHRVILFAAAREAAFIWIDQECIQQDDPFDQREGIQAMDLVYQRAQDSVGLLNIFVDSQEYIDALSRMLEVEGIEADELGHLAGVLELICSDRWFTRAWILQESTSAGAMMKLMVRCDRELEVSENLASEHGGYIEISVTELHDILSSWLPVTLESMKDEIDEELYERLSAVKDRWFGMTPPEASTGGFNKDTRLACNAAEALHFLGKRLNTVVADRLAIMANLCNYKARLDSNQLDKLGFGFSICALALAILNGDISILNGYVEASESRHRNHGSVDFLQPDDSIAQVIRWGYGWCPPVWGRFDGLAYLDRYAEDLRIKVLSMTETGLLVEGWVWVADEQVDLSGLTEQYYAQGPHSTPLTDELTHGTIDRQHIVDFLVRLLCHLHNNGYQSLVHLLFLKFRWAVSPKLAGNNEENARYSKASFEEIYDTKTGQLNWENPIVQRGGAPKYTDPFISFGLDRAARSLFKAVLSRSTLRVARPMCATPQPQEYAAVFANQEERLFFSPCNNHGAELARTQYGWSPMSWSIVDTNNSTPEGHRIFRCQGLRQGTWVADDSQVEAVALS